MAENDVFEDFSKKLRRGLGKPDGITEQEVCEDINFRYQEVFRALDAYGARLTYQSAKMLLTYEIANVDLTRFSATYNVQIRLDNDEVSSMTLMFNQEGIQAKDGYLATEGQAGRGWYPVELQEIFISHLGDALLRTVGAVPSE